MPTYSVPSKITLTCLLEVAAVQHVLLN